MGAPMGGFFYGADVAFATLAPSAAAHEVPAEALTPPTEPIPIDEGTHNGKVSEATPVPAKTLTPQEVATPPTTVQTEVASPVTPFVISTSDPFAVLSQAVKDGSSLVITTSSIPSSATRGPNVDLSSEGSKDVLKDPDDEPVLKKRIFYFDYEESAPPKTKFMGMCLFPFPFFFLLFFAKFILPIFLSSLPYTYVFASPLCCNLPLFVCLFHILQRLLRGQGS